MDSPVADGIPPSLDPVALARWRMAAPAQSPWLHEEVGRRMEPRLELIKRPPSVWCDWEAVRGGLQVHESIAARYPKAEQWIFTSNPAHQRYAQARWQGSVWQRLRGKSAVHFGQPTNGQLDMIWANMALHEMLNPPQTIAHWASMLHANGFVMFSCFGPDTLRELRQLYAARGWPAPTQDFTDMHDLGDMLVQHGFSEPVMDMEHIRLEFSSPERLVQELRELGRNLHPQRFPALRGRQWHQQLLAGLGSLANEAGQLGLNFEIVYGHAFKAPTRMPVAQETKISLQDMRGALKRRSES